MHDEKHQAHAELEESHMTVKEIHEQTAKDLADLMAGQELDPPGH